MAQTIRVLITDDSVRARHGLCALLSTWPEVEVVGEATNGREAMLLILECRPDVVLMDVQMPMMDGLEATRRIKSRWPEIHVIVLTIYTAQQKAALAAGADAFVIKGGSPERLLTALSVYGAVSET